MRTVTTVTLERSITTAERALLLGEEMENFLNDLFSGKIDSILYLLRSDRFSFPPRKMKILCNKHSIWTSGDDFGFPVGALGASLDHARGAEYFGSTSDSPCVLLALCEECRREPHD